MRASSSSVSASTYQEPPSGSATSATPVSSWTTCCVRRPIRCASREGVRIASSKAEISIARTPARVSASACTAPRAMLLASCCEVIVAPEVWAATLMASERGSWAPNSSRIIRAYSRRDARILAISAKKSMRQLTSSAMRGAKRSTSTPRAISRRTTSRSSTKPSAISSTMLHAAVADVVRVLDERVELRHVVGAELDRVGGQPHVQLDGQVRGSTRCPRRTAAAGSPTRAAPATRGRGPRRPGTGRPRRTRRAASGRRLTRSSGMPS